MSLCLAVRAPAFAEDFPKPDAEGTVTVSPSSTHGSLVIFLSGDGGWWGDIDAQMAAHLARYGYAVLGLDTNVWFDSPRQPGEIAGRIEGMIRSYQKVAPLRHVVLIGYSFGADMVPLIYNRLAWRERALVKGMILIAPGRLASLQVTLAERTGLAQGTLDLAPELAKLPAAKLRCIYGRDEAGDSGCTLAAVKPALRTGLPGGHHFEHNIALLDDTVLKMAQALTLTRGGPSSLRW